MDNIDTTEKTNISEMKKRDKLYSQLLKQYASNQDSMHKARRVFKYVFFSIICISFLSIIAAGITILIIVAKRDNTNLEDLGIALTGLGSILGVINVLPKIIAEHLFPKDGDNAESSLVTTMQKFDLDKSNDVDFSPISDDEIDSIMNDDYFESSIDSENSD